MPNNEDLPTPGAERLLAAIGRLASGFLLVWVLIPQAISAEPPASGPVTWKTGSDLERQLRSTVGIRWTSNPLRRALTRLSQNQGVAVFLDRRVDPDQPVEFSATSKGLYALLQDVAGHIGQGACRVGPVVYIGPKRTAAVLATVAARKEDESRGLSPAVQDRLRRARPLNWPELTEPRGLVERLAGEVGLSVEGIERIPHDLWPKVELPPLDFNQRMSLVLAGFGLTFDYDQNASVIHLVPMPATAVVERSYRLRGGQARVEAVLGRRFPEARITVASGKLTVIGTVEEHEAIRRILQGTTETPAKSPVGGQTVYTLTIRSPVRQIARGLAKQLGLEIEFAPGTEQKLDQLVTLDVKNVPLDDLLQALFQPAGLSYELTGQSLRVLPGRTP